MEVNGRIVVWRDDGQPAERVDTVFSHEVQAGSELCRGEIFVLWVGTVDESCGELEGREGEGHDGLGETDLNDGLFGGQEESMEDLCGFVGEHGVPCGRGRRQPGACGDL